MAQPLHLRIDFKGPRGVAQRVCIQWLPAAPSIEPSLNVIDVRHRHSWRHTSAARLGRLHSIIGPPRESAPLVSPPTDHWILYATVSVCIMSYGGESFTSPRGLHHPYNEGDLIPLLSVTIEHPPMALFPATSAYFHPQ